ncbi:Flagellar motor switch protein FliN [subsurface metagenome]
MKNGKINYVKIPIEVVLGRTELTVEEMANVSPGSVIELDKLAGEPVDMVAAGEVVAKGEVVVVDENFGIRVTDIVNKGE